jgi:peptidoglycan hydrolase CwlO-like protein
MVLINDIWHDPKDLDDVSQIIRELFSWDLADKMDELVEASNRDYEDNLESKDNEIDDLNEEINNFMNDIQDLQNEIDELREE